MESFPTDQPKIPAETTPLIPPIETQKAGHKEEDDLTKIINLESEERVKALQRLGKVKIAHQVTIVNRAELGKVTDLSDFLGKDLLMNEDPVVYLALGRLESDPSKKITFLRKAVEKGNEAARGELAHALLDLAGKIKWSGTHDDKLDIYIKEAHKLLEDFGLKEDPSLYYKAAELLNQPHEKNKSIEYYSIAVSQGHQEAFETWKRYLESFKDNEEYLLEMQLRGSNIAALERGDILLKQKAPQLAILAYKAALENIGRILEKEKAYKGDDIERNANYGLGKAYQLQGKMELAIDHFERAAKAGSSQSQKELFIHWRIKAEETDNEVAKAGFIILAAEFENPENIYRLGAHYLEKGNLALAEKYFKDSGLAIETEDYLKMGLLEKNPVKQIVYLRKAAEGGSAKGKIELRSAILEQANGLQDGPEKLKLYYEAVSLGLERADIYYKMSKLETDPEKKISLLRKLAEHGLYDRPQLRSLYDDLGKKFPYNSKEEVKFILLDNIETAMNELEQGELKEGIDLLKNCLQANSDTYKDEEIDREAGYELGKAYLSAGDIKLALDNLMSAATKGSSKATVELYLYHSKKLDEAIDRNAPNAEIDQIVLETMKYETPEGKRQLGRYYLEKDDLVSAERNLKDSSLEVNYELGRIYKIRRNGEKAKEYFARAAEIGVPEAIWEMLVLTKDDKEAFEKYKKMVEAMTQDTLGVTARTKLLLYKLYFLEKYIEEGIADINTLEFINLSRLWPEIEPKALKKAADAGEEGAIRTYAVYLYEQNRIDEAAEYFKKHTRIVLKKYGEINNIRKEVSKLFAKDGDGELLASTINTTALETFEKDYALIAEAIRAGRKEARETGFLPPEIRDIEGTPFSGYSGGICKSMSLKFAARALEVLKSGGGEDQLIAFASKFEKGGDTVTVADQVFYSTITQRTSLAWHEAIGALDEVLDEQQFILAVYNLSFFMTDKKMAESLLKEKGLNTNPLWITLKDNSIENLEYIKALKGGKKEGKVEWMQAMKDLESSFTEESLELIADLLEPIVGDIKWRIEATMSLNTKDFLLERAYSDARREVSADRNFVKQFIEERNAKLKSSASIVSEPLKEGSAREALKAASHEKPKTTRLEQYIDIHFKQRKYTDLTKDDRAKLVGNLFKKYCDKSSFLKEFIAEKALINRIKLKQNNIKMDVQMDDSSRINTILKNEGVYLCGLELEGGGHSISLIVTKDICYVFDPNRGLIRCSKTDPKKTMLTFINAYESPTKGNHNLDMTKLEEPIAEPLVA